MADETTAAEVKADAKPSGVSGLTSEAMQAFGIRLDHILASKDYGNKVVIVTKGGSKVIFERGDKVLKLSEANRAEPGDKIQLTKVQLDGVPPPKPKK